jgi:hypothetical protein
VLRSVLIDFGEQLTGWEVQFETAGQH